MKKLIDFEELSHVRNWYVGKRVVHCHGVFDLFHIGHLAHLKSARAFGDVLVVTITPDRFVNKGPGRPRYTAEQRAMMLAALDLVDHVAINKHPKAVEPIKLLKPHFYVKGPDYRQTQTDITGAILEEKDAVHAGGGELVFTEDETQSSTELLNQYFSSWDENQKLAIEQTKAAMSVERLIEGIHELSKLKILVVGEPIVDTYVFCNAEGISSKSPTVSARFLSQEDYAGGSLAIANHLAALGCSVDLLITHGGESYFRNILAQNLAPNIQLSEVVTPGIPTPRKTRYVIPHKAQRIFELIDLRADQWRHADPTPFITKLAELSAKNDITMVADFGHGMFEGPALEAAQTTRSFKALNVQTNSGNFGFNPFTKHTHFDYLCIDERECRVATHDRFTPAIELARKTFPNQSRKATCVTLGTAGSSYYDRNGEEHLCPTFAGEIIDTTGAGDAYFAITSALVKTGFPAPVIPFIGNCYAGLKAKIIGNKSAVSKVDLIRCVQAILK